MILPLGLRRVVVAAALVTASVPPLFVAAAPAGAATTPVPGSYVAFATQSRVVDTHTGAGGNRKGAIPAGRTITVTVAGVGRVPRTGVGSVVVTVTASQPTGTGALVLYGGTRPATTNLNFAAGRPPVTDTAVVPLSAGRMHISNTARRGSVQVAVDVSGYYRSGSASNSEPGAFHALPTARRVVALQPHANAVVTTAIGGHAGVPAGAGAAAVTLTVWGATRGGTILGYRPDEPRQNLPLVRFTAGTAVSSFAVVRLSGGRTTFVNTSGSTVHLAVDVAGWYTIGFARSAAAFQTVLQTRVVNRSLAGGANVTLNLAGRGGVPLGGVAAVLATVHALSPTRTGGLQAWRADVRRPRSTTVLQFQSGRSASNVAMLPVTSDGRVSLHNTAPGKTGLEIDVDGYVPSTALGNPARTATARYVRNISGAPGDVPTMQQEGATDAAAGYTFVLLDIGAQANDASGVVLSATDVNLTYSQLVTAVDAYLDGFTTNGHTGTVAVGTNNGANDWTKYTPTARGTDWATKVVRPLADHAAGTGVTVIGANDLEAGFYSTEPQAAAWKTAFLGSMPGTGTALVYNGSADFCPKTWTPNAACNFGWTEQRLHELAGGARTVVLPQIYFGYMATQWAMVDKSGPGRLHFLGALTEYAMDSGSLQPAQGWTALRRAVSSVTGTAIGNWAADIHT